MKKKTSAMLKITSLFLGLLLLVSLVAACGQPGTRTGLSGKLQIFHAGSLTMPFAQVRSN